MPKLRTTPCILPESQIVCQLGLSYFDQLALQRILIKTQGLDALTDKYAVIQEFQVELCLKGIRSWNDPDPITADSLAQLSKADIDGVVAQLMPLLGVTEPDEGSKKNAESTPAPSKGNAKLPSTDSPSGTPSKTST